MITINAKLQYSSPRSKTGTVSYQITHQQKTCQPLHSDSDETTERTSIATATGLKEHRLLHHLIESDRALLRRIVYDLDMQEMIYTLDDSHPQPQHSAVRHQCRHGIQLRTDYTYLSCTTVKPCY